MRIGFVNIGISQKVYQVIAYTKVFKNIHLFIKLKKLKNLIRYPKSQFLCHIL